jgi:AcrR family transcriptional regulator
MDATRSASADLSPRAAAAAPPAERLLRTASNLFAAQGIRAVGIDTILREAAVAKASLYSTYRSKDALVFAYLNDLDLRDRNGYQTRTANLKDPVDKVLAFFDLAIVNGPKRDFRGCLYANAATEFPGVELGPVRAHRDWVLATITGLLREAGVAEPKRTARKVQLMYDGALVGSKIDRSVEPIRIARRVAAELISAAGFAQADRM